MEIGQDIFEDNELEELKQLTLQHRRGQISDMDFEEQAAWLLKGRSFPVLTSNVALPFEEANSNETKKEHDLSALTSCGERSKRARQSYIRKHKELKQESLVMKTFKNESSSKHKKSLSDSTSIEEKISTNSLITNRLSKINKNIEEFEIKKRITPIILALCAVIILISSVLAYLLMKKQGNKTVSIDQLTKILIAHEKNPSIPLIFGPVTVSQCNALCNAKSAENCENACRKLSFEMYPHRITLNENSPEFIANKTAESCKTTFRNEKKSTNNDMQVPFMNFQALDNLALNELTTEYSKVSELHESLQKGPKDNKNLENASVLLCMRANEINSYIGAIVANSYRDHYAVAYYQLTQRAFANKNATIKDTINY